MEKTWDLVPLSGTFEGQIVAHVDGAMLTDARFDGGRVGGDVKVLWGTDVIMEEIYDDPETLRGLCLGKAFRDIPGCRAVLDRDGFKDGFDLHPLRGAKRVMIIGDCIYTKGQLRA